MVDAETYPAAMPLYYIDGPGAGGSVPPDDAGAESPPNPLDRLSARDFLLLREPAGIGTLVLAGYQLSLVLFTLGLVLPLVGFDAPVHSDSELWAAAGNLLAVCVAIRVAERLARRARSRRDRS